MSNRNWILKITLCAFIISFVFSFLSETIMPSTNIIFSIIMLFSFIVIGIVFDMIGVAITSANIKPFHSMNAKKIKGAQTAIRIINNAPKFSSVCNDVIGDICGIISGSAGVIIANSLSRKFNIDLLLISLFVTAFIAALTIGGKAFFKSIAVRKSTKIICLFSRVMSFFYK